MYIPGVNVIIETFTKYYLVIVQITKEKKKEKKKLGR